MSAIELREVDFVRAGRSILNHIDLVVERGEQWALLGPNGAGKSSLLAICAAVTFPSRGTARILDSVMGRVDLRELRRSIGVVDPRHPLQSNLSATEVVLTGVTSTIEVVPRWQPTEADVVRARNLVRQLGIDERAAWLTMSQGERGRTLIARALMTDPDLLVLDEPSTGLDLAAREQLIRTIDAIGERHPGITTVMVTHHFEELPSGVTHAALMRKGLIVAAGPVEQILTSAQVSECFDHPIVVERRGGRWAARGA